MMRRSIWWSWLNCRQLENFGLSQSWSLTLPLQNVDDDPLVDAINTMLTFNASVTNAVE